MLVLRFSQSTLWTPITPTIRPPGSTIAVCSPSLSAICLRVARMKGSTSAGERSLCTHGIHGPRCSRLASMSAKSSSASDSSSRRSA